MFTENPLRGSIDAVAEPENINDVSKLEIAERGILNNFSPLPLKNEPVNKKILPVNCEPLSAEITLKPSSLLTEAVTLPLAMSAEINASGASAVLGILNNFSPEPEKNEPVYKKILPVNCEPLSAEITLNPSFGATDAVTLPLAIRNTSSDNAERGISNSPLPLPLIS